MRIFNYILNFDIIIIVVHGVIGIFELNAKKINILNIVQLYES